MTMKQLYKVPFENNSERVKDLRYQYVQVTIGVHLVSFSVILRCLYYLKF